MCECGCSQGPDFYFPGPDGITYGLELYHGCGDCGNAPGISLVRIPDKHLDDFGPADWRKPVPWFAHSGWKEYTANLVDEGLLQQAVAEDEEGDLVAALDDDGEVSEELAKDIARCAWNAILRVAFKSPTKEGT